MYKTKPLQNYRGWHALSCVLSTQGRLQQHGVFDWSRVIGAAVSHGRKAVALIERKRGRVRCPHLQADVQRPGVSRPVLAGPDQGTPNTLPAIPFVDHQALYFSRFQEK